MADEKDKLEEELELMAAREAGKAAGRSAWEGIKATVGGLADGVLSRAERELAAAEAARGRGPLTRAPGEPASQASERALESVRRAAPPGAGESAMARRRAREARAREQLEALKQAHAEGRPLRPPPEPEEEEVLPASIVPREESPAVRRSLDGAEDHPAQPEDREPAKRTL
jgi:hypothetical protein